MERNGLMGNVILKCTNLSKTYDFDNALNNVNLSIETGKIIGLLGPNGSGKTTFIKLLNGLLKPTSGDIVIDGWNTKDYTVAKMSRKVGYVFQNPMDQIFHNNVYDEIEFGPKKIGYSENERKNYLAIYRPKLKNASESFRIFPNNTVNFSTFFLG